jgi:hypothetical protein
MPRELAVDSAIHSIVINAYRTAVNNQETLVDKPFRGVSLRKEPAAKPSFGPDLGARGAGGAAGMRHNAIERSALLLLLLCGGCSSDSGRPPASDVGQRAAALYTDCLDRAAHKLDDHSADVKVLASTVSGACIYQAREYEKTFYQGLPPAERDAKLDKLSTGESRERAAIQAVLRERAAQ